MDIFDPHHDVETKELILTEYNMNKIIYGQMVYVIYDDYKNDMI